MESGDANKGENENIMAVSNFVENKTFICNTNYLQIN